MATIDLGKIKIVWRGTYAGGTAYTPDDAVVLNGTSYICIANTTGNTPPNGTYWNVLAQAGTNGTDVGTTLTTQGDLLYRDGSGLQRLAKGTAGQALLMNTAANAPEWGAGGEKNTPAFDVRPSTGQAISNNTNTKIVFGTENIDTDGCFANSRFTPTTAGYYQFNAGVGGAAKSGYIALWLKKNGSEDHYFVDSSSHSSSYTEQGTLVLYLNGSGDYVELYINMANGRTLSATQNGSTRFAGYRIIT